MKFKEWQKENSGKAIGGSIWNHPTQGAHVLIHVGKAKYVVVSCSDKTLSDSASEIMSKAELNRKLYTEEWTLLGGYTLQLRAPTSMVQPYKFGVFASTSTAIPVSLIP
jgi:hypothetical protein